MKASPKPFPLILIAATATIPALANAARTPALMHRRLDAATTRPVAWAPGRGLAQMDLAPRFYLKRPYAPRLIPAPSPDTATTALSRQVASDGPIGSVGVINLSGSETLRDRSFGDSLASQRGLPSRALGFRVSYNFP